jgi:single-stranded-DNA-specific exonuclease
MLDLVALGTVCDVVPLTGVNRAFVVKGMLAIGSRRNAGIATLARVSRIGEPLIAAYHFGFMIGPAHQCRWAYRRCGAGQQPAFDGRSGRSRRRLPKHSTASMPERQAMEQAMLAEAQAPRPMRNLLAAGARRCCLPPVPANGIPALSA